MMPVIQAGFWFSICPQGETFCHVADLRRKQNMGLLTGKTALITGALGTIGKALVMRYCEEGARVVASDRPDMQNVDDTLRPLGAGIRYFGADLDDLPVTEKAINELAEE